MFSIAFMLRDNFSKPINLTGNHHKKSNYVFLCDECFYDFLQSVVVYTISQSVPGL